jgi:hypothetical protein
MPVVDFAITRDTPFGDTEFGAAGRYHQLDGTVTFAVDPHHAANRHIVDLPHAKAHSDGKVHFSADFSLVTPVDMARGNGRLIVDVPNRGNKLTAAHFHQVAAVSAADRDNPGDAFLCHRGFSVVAIGWQWDSQAEGGLGLRAPEALIDGRAIDGEVLMRLQPDADVPSLPLVQLGQVRPSYPVFDPESPDHRLYVGHGSGQQRVPRNQWRFASWDNGRVGDSARHIYLAAGFKKGTVYELIYRTRGAPVVGSGLLAIRDIAACLRYRTPASPLSHGFTHAYAFGVSQTGRVLRQFLYEGLNTDESDRVVFDGMLIHIAGGQRGDFNHRFAQPTVANIPGFGQRFPFAAATQTDPFSTAEDGLFAKLAPRAIPRVMFSNTSWEYWRGDAGLTHTLQDRDIEAHPNTRIYHIAGTHHIGGILVGGKQVTRLPTGLQTTLPLNVVNSAPVFRALFTALDRWVTAGIAPPPSCHPAEVLLKFADRGFTAAIDPAKLPRLHRMDFGPDATLGVATQPIREFEAYTAWVADVDAELNEIGGIRLPDVACPLGFHTGWNPRSTAIGAADELATFAGFSVFFSREAILARYHDEAGYMHEASQCIDDLIANGFVLPQDRDWMINIARSRFRAAIAISVNH